MNTQRFSKILFIAIFLLAAFFRFYGINWDQDQHLHPDERFLTMVADGISWPDSLSEYLDTEVSPLNPHNRGFGFFVYGTFPIFFTKWVAESLGKGDYGNLTLVGRQLSAFADLGTVLLVFLIAKTIKTPPEKWQSDKDTLGEVTRRGSPDGEGSRNNWVIGLFAAFIYAASVLPIQLSHFYAVDTYLTFFITLSFYLLIVILNEVKDLDRRSQSPRFARFLAMLGMTKYSILGITFGLALASKITALLFLPIIGIGFLTALLKEISLKSPKTTSYQSCYSVLIKGLIYGFIFVIGSYFTFRISQPYLFANANLFDPSLNPKVLENWKQLKSFDDATGGFPPAVQWITSKPYLFPLKNIILWGMGLPLGIIAILGMVYQMSQFLLVISNVVRNLVPIKSGRILRFARSLAKARDDNINLILNLSLLWVLLLFFYQGGQFVKALRYFFPIYPFLAIVSGYFLFSLRRLNLLRGSTSLGFWFIGLLVLIYPLSFISIYSRPHSRVAASQWIYQNIPAGSTISGEHWDDFLPMSLPIPGYIHEKYKSVELPLYYPDKPEKWKEMDTKLKTVDYIILSSNRLYGSITTVPAKFPVTNRYYQALFDGSLGFEKVAEFTSRPNIPFPFIKSCIIPPFARYGIIASQNEDCPLLGISLVDDYADETFTVYDHPKVIIFKKVKTVDYYDLLMWEN